MILALTVVLWVTSVQVNGGTTLATVLSAMAGIGALICAYSFHEWGHLVAALMTDSVYTPAKRLMSPFLFAYDEKQNGKRQFAIMSLGGFAASAIFLVGFALWMPQDQLAGRIALKGAIVLVSLTVIIEFPIFFRALLGTTLPRTGVFGGPTVGGGKNTATPGSRKP